MKNACKQCNILFLYRFLLHSTRFIPIYRNASELNLSRPVHFRKLYQNKNELKILFSHFFVVPQKGFMRAFKAFIKPLEAPQRSAKIKI